MLSLPTASAKQWNPDRDVVSPNKKWTIEFNMNMDEEQVQSNRYVAVVDGNGNAVDINRSLNGKTLIVTPTGSYEAGGSYRLVIDEALSAENGASLKEDIVMPFTIQQTKSSTDNSGYEPSAYEKKVLELVNNERTDRGISPLKLSDSLSEVAHAKARDMATNGYFSHTSPTYGSPFDMMNQFDISYRAAAENIAAGQRSPEAVVESWMNSSGHRKNILNDEYTHLGNGYVEGGGKYGTYWAQMFISK